MLLFHTDSASKFTSFWKAPYKIVEGVPNSYDNYVVSVKGITKHLLKLFEEMS